MSRRGRKEVAMIVRMSVWSDRPARVVLADVREALADFVDPHEKRGISADGRYHPARLVSVAPIPADRMIKPRKKRERRKVPGLLAAMGITR